MLRVLRWYPRILQNDRPRPDVQTLQVPDLCRVLRAWDRTPRPLVDTWLHPNRRTWHTVQRSRIVDGAIGRGAYLVLMSTLQK